MTILIISIFVLGYIAIAMEHPLRLNKAASALLTGVLCWTVFILFNEEDHHFINEQLLGHLGEISSILFFLLGAMTIVELIDTHHGFEILTLKLTTTSKQKLFVIVTVLSFFLSALLDNLTTAIVMTSLVSKLIKVKEDKLWFAGMIVIAANAGGAWSPLGDVTTTMLWIGGQITALNVVLTLILPSIMVCLFPAIIIWKRFKGKNVESLPEKKATEEESKTGKKILIYGISFLVFVPVFKTVSNLPPFMGMMLAIGFMWIITTRIHKRKQNAFMETHAVARALEKVDTSSILFFLGILLAVACLQTMGLLKDVAHFLTENLKNDYLIGTSLGLFSAIVDNVPLVAASQGMFDMNTYPTDHRFWEFLALTTGTGGSAIIIGSAAGVAVMGIEKIEFLWYLKKISLLSLIGYAAGIITFILQQSLSNG